MLGWFSAPAARASTRSKRRRRSGSLLNAGSTLTASQSVTDQRRCRGPNDRRRPSRFTAEVIQRSRRNGRAGCPFRWSLGAESTQRPASLSGVFARPRGGRCPSHLVHRGVFAPIPGFWTGSVHRGPHSHMPRRKEHLDSDAVRSESTVAASRHDSQGKSPLPRRVPVIGQWRCLTPSPRPHGAVRKRIYLANDEHTDCCWTGDDVTLPPPRSRHARASTMAAGEAGVHREQSR